tara:strand:+ start:24109 stop:25344 length:1236 start_codon:yes stop_codon:yes gene_type:complete
MQSDLINEIFKGANSRQSLYDLSIPKNWNNKLIIFIHGYMGYKDWGCWNLVSDFFVKEGYGFLKYNVSHNGGTIDNPIDFDDLDAFSENNYSKEIEDFEAILKVVENSFEKISEIYLIGHSRGGGIALLQSQNEQVDRICSWAGIASIVSRFPTGKQLEAWRNNGFYIRENGRTKQQMPHSYSQYEDFLQNKTRLNIEKYCRDSKKPTLVIHGEEDQSVTIEEGREIADWIGTELIPIACAQHTFGAKQPWERNELPEELLVVCKLTLQFFELKFKNDRNLHQEKMSLLSDLVKLARADQLIKTSEIEFLTYIAIQLGINDKDFNKIIHEDIDFVTSKSKADRILQFQRLILLMNIDGEINDREISFLMETAVKMSLSPEAVKNVLKKMKANNGQALDINDLQDIFSVGLN